MTRSKSLVSGMMSSSGVAEIEKVVVSDKEKDRIDIEMEDDPKNNNSEVKTSISEDIDDGIYSVSSDGEKRKKNTSLCSCFQLVCYNRRFL